MCFQIKIIIKILIQFINVCLCRKYTVYISINEVILIYLLFSKIINTLLSNNSLLFKIKLLNNIKTIMQQLLNSLGNI